MTSQVLTFSKPISAERCAPFAAIRLRSIKGETSDFGGFGGDRGLEFDAFDPDATLCCCEACLGGGKNEDGLLGGSGGPTGATAAALPGCCGIEFVLARNGFGGGFIIFGCCTEGAGEEDARE